MSRNFRHTTHKFEKNTLNEDAAIAKEQLIAVSDGAGGGGVFAEKWSRYLLKQLPAGSPITSFSQLDDWIDKIWEPFYTACEKEALTQGGLFLEKFYDEGSFATLAAAWKVKDEYVWMTYGDTMVFHYDTASGELEHSPMQLADFNKAPYLISDKDPLREQGFMQGRFKASRSSVVIIASDTLAHFILMMYEISKKDIYQHELKTAVDALSKNSSYIKTAMKLKFDFDKWLNKLTNPKTDFRKEMGLLYRNGLIGHDDYSIAVMF